MWCKPEFLKIGPLRHVSWRHGKDKAVYGPDYSGMLVGTTTLVGSFSAVMMSFNEILGKKTLHDTL